MWPDSWPSMLRGKSITNTHTLTHTHTHTPLPSKHPPPTQDLNAQKFPAISIWWLNPLLHWRCKMSMADCTTVGRWCHAQTLGMIYGLLQNTAECHTMTQDHDRWCSPRLPAWSQTSFSIISTTSGGQSGRRFGSHWPQTGSWSLLQYRKSPPNLLMITSTPERGVKRASPVDSPYATTPGTKCPTQFSLERWSHPSVYDTVE